MTSESQDFDLLLLHVMAAWLGIAQSTSYNRITWCLHFAREVGAPVHLVFGVKNRHQQLHTATILWPWKIEC